MKIFTSKSLILTAVGMAVPASQSQNHFSFPGPSVSLNLIRKVLLAEVQDISLVLLTICSGMVISSNFFDTT